MMAPGCRLNSRPSGGRLRQSVRSGRSWRTFRSWKLRPTAADAGRRRSGRRSRHVDKTGTESEHRAGTDAGAIRGVHCRPLALSVLCNCAVVELPPALYECRLLSRVVVEWCCGGLPPPGKGPSPEVWGEGLYRLSLDAVDVRATGCRTLRVPKWVRLVAPLPLSGSRERPRLVWAGVFSFLAPALASLRNSAAVRPRSASSRWLCGVWWSSGVAAGIPVMLLCAGV